MAIYPSSSAFAQNNTGVASEPVPVNIAAWTEQAIQSLNATNASSQSGVRGTSVTLAIDLDENAIPKRDANAAESSSNPRVRREPIRRDSMKRREALLKGKEGSRRRTRWENGLYHN